MAETKTAEYTIDAEGKRLGRIATEAASVLMGKNRTDFVRHQIPEVKVRITNASKTLIDEKKREQKEYKSFSGYPSGLKFESLESLSSRKGYDAIFRKAIKRMLPANRLRDNMLKNLEISE